MAFKKKTKKVKEKKAPLTLDNFVTLGDVLEESVDFISTGCLVADLAMGGVGGGFARKRMAQIYGIESSFKTGILLSTAAQFQHKFPDGYFVYDDAESSLETGWARRAFRLDKDRTIPLRAEEGKASFTVEGFVESVYRFCNWAVQHNVPLLYGLDSFDPLKTVFTTKEPGQDDGKDSMRDKLDKAAVISQKIRDLVQLINQADCTLVIISHAKQKIGVFFGDPYDTTGGSAIKFYSSQRPRMSEIGMIKDTKKRVMGVMLKIFMKKNKVARPFRDAEFPFYFDSGIDDVEACVDFLRKYSNLVGSQSYNFPEDGNNFKSKEDLIDFVYDNNLVPELHEFVIDIWKKEGF